MTAFLVLTGYPPFIVITAESAVSDGRLAESLQMSGFDKFIAREISLDALRDRYGLPLEVIEAEVNGGKELRVLDSSGTHVFENVSFADLGTCIRYDGAVAHR
jgi:hypothetical protein